MRWILAFVLAAALGAAAGCASRRHLNEQTGQALEAVFAAQAKAAREGKDSPSSLGAKESVAIYQGYQRSFLGEQAAMGMAMGGGGAGGGAGLPPSGFSMGGH